MASAKSNSSRKFRSFHSRLGEAKIWKTAESEARHVLDGLASRAVLRDTETPSGHILYVLPPRMAGFFEFSMMRLCGDVDQKALAELYYQYTTVEDDFIRAR